MHKLFLVMAASVSMSMILISGASASTRFAGNAMASSTACSGGEGVCIVSENPKLFDFELDLDKDTLIPDTITFDQFFKITFDPNGDLTGDTVSINFDFDFPSELADGSWTDTGGITTTGGQSYSTGGQLYSNNPIVQFFLQLFGQAHKSQRMHYNHSTGQNDTYNQLNISWEGTSIVFGSLVLDISLSDVTLECKDDKHGRCFDPCTDWIKATFELSENPNYNPPNEVPLPAALPLFATSLLGFGYMGFRRRKAG